MNYSERNIILIEDDHSLANLITRTLKGYKVTHFASVESYMLKGFDVKYALYLVDDILPGMRGNDFVRIKRKSSRLLPIITISAKDGYHDIIEGLKAGADDYLAKPLNLEELKVRVDSAWTKLSQMIQGGYISL
jgi:DNA-binding response OmpR family regulator